MKNDDPVDYSSGVVSARWWGVGIFSLARVAPAAKFTWSETFNADAGCARRVISIPKADAPLCQTRSSATMPSSG